MSDNGDSNNPNKRLFPFADDGPSRQYKVRVNDLQLSSTNEAYMNEVYARTNSLLFEGARRASAGAQPQEMNEVPAQDECEDMDTSLGEVEFRKFRNSMLKRLHVRDPSPMPGPKKRLSFNEKSKGKENKELNTEYVKFHNLRQLCLDPFMRRAAPQQNLKEEPKEQKDEPKDENFNDEGMEY